MDYENILARPSNMKDVPHIPGISDVFVMPSWEEGLKCGNNGSNGRRIAGCVIELLNSPTKAAAFGKAGRKKAEELFTIEQMVEKYQQAIMDILGCL
jgi:hypothetical protein